MSIEKIQHLTLVKVSGEDAKTFLQGQLTNDVHQLDHIWQFSAYCTPKGRALAVLIIWQHHDDVYLLLESDIKETILKRLRMYVMRSKVEFADVPCSIFGVYEQDALTSVAPDLLVNTTRYQCHTLDKQHALFFGNRCLIIDLSWSFGPEGQPTLDHQTIFASCGNWVKHDIMECLPRVTSDSSELFVPQMLNMEILNGVSFKKGCYTGQEIVARMHYLGKLKQRNFVCSLEPNANIGIGDKIMDKNGKTVGHVSNAVPEGVLATAVLRFDNLDHELHSEQGSQLTLLDEQPYELAATNN